MRPPNTCTHYIYCMYVPSSNVWESTIRKCPTCLRANGHSGLCDHVPNVPECSNGESNQSNCTGEGTFPDTVDPRKYYICKFDENGNLILDPQVCKESQVYNPSTLTCDTPDNVTPIDTPGECNESGFFPHPVECHKFYSCVEGENSSWIKTEMECPTGLMYDEHQEYCDDPSDMDLCKYSTVNRYNTAYVPMNVINADTKCLNSFRYLLTASWTIILAEYERWLRLTVLFNIT